MIITIIMIRTLLLNGRHIIVRITIIIFILITSIVNIDIAFPILVEIIMKTLITAIAKPAGY